MPIRLHERAGLSGGDGSLPFLLVEQDLPLPAALHIAGRLSTEGMSIDVTRDDTYLVSYCGGSPYWWLPGTHGGGMHQVSSHGWCHDFHDDGRLVHHLPLDVEIAVLTCEATHDQVLRDLVRAAGETPEQFARRVAGRGMDIARC